MLDKRSFGLDLLRTFAIAFVLLAHFAKIFESVGFWGVELFFALSGYLIGKIIWKNYSANGNYSFVLVTNFWKRRWWRTIPNYWLFLLITIGFQYIRNSNIVSYDLIIKSVLFIQNFISREEVFYSVSWSLCIEEWFYLLFPLMLLILSFFKLSPKITYIICITIFIVVSIYLRKIFIINQVGHTLRGITLARLDAIVYGVAISFISIVLKNKPKIQYFMFSIGVLLLIFCIKQVHFSEILYDEIRSQQIYLMLAPLSFSLIIPIMEKIQMNYIQLKWFKKSVQNISLWSYSIYLSHIPVMFTTYYLTFAIRINGMGNLVSKLIGLLLTIMVSALIYKYFEKPLTNKRPKEIGKI